MFSSSRPSPPPAAEATLQADLQRALVDRYTIDRELGRGGMATVLLALDLKHDRRVALKLLRRELGAVLGAERFQREIRLTARLQHPHILPIFDSGAAETPASAPPWLWYTMPFVDGGTLRDRLRREVQLPVEEALRIAREAARALAYAHSHGIIHRDIKPENLLLTSDGNTLVSDFGIARATADDAERLTETGLTLGTPAYMSPEQASGDRALDGRTDVYSLGAVLYEMLAGEPPYTGPTAQAIVSKRLTGPVPSVRQLRPTTPRAVDQTIRRALAPIAADRFATAAEFAQALEEAEAPRAPRRLPVVVAGLALAAALGLFFARWPSRTSAGRTGVQHLAVLPFENEGDSVDAYFAEGIADELRGRLATLPGLEVIASRSSNAYRGSTKSLPEIARDLGVDYLLMGRVLWRRQPGGMGRVEVTPELVRVVPGASPTTRWTQSFDAPLTDVFRMQGDIASRVAGSLDVALGAGVPESLATPVTASPEAYDDYLRANQAYERGTVPDLRLANDLYRQALARDSAFALAWARLARSEALLARLGGDRSAAQLGRIEQAARRALALAPGLSEAHAAMGYLDFWGREDFARALEEFSLAARGKPNDAELAGVMGLVLRRQGRWNESIADLERASTLDPRSSFVLTDLGESYLRLRRYADAERVLDRAAALSPDVPFAYDLLIRLAVNRDGDLTEARRIARDALQRMAFARLVGSGYRLLGFLPLYALVLSEDTDSGRLATLTPATMDDDTVGYLSFKASLFRVRGERTLARIYDDSTRAAALARSARHEATAFTEGRLGVADAYLRRETEAIDAGRRAVALLPLAKDAVFGQEGMLALAEVYAVLGRADEAVDQLEALLAMPSFVSGPGLRADPVWAPLRSNARFERITGARPAG